MDDGKNRNVASMLEAWKAKKPRIHLNMIGLDEVNNFDQSTVAMHEKSNV